MSKVNGLIGCMMVIAIMSALSVPVVAEGLLHHPESVVFDSLRNRYLAANFDDGNIIAIDSEGQQSIFASPGGNCLGSVIVRDTLYVTQLQRVIGFDLATAELVFNLEVASQPYLEGIDSDGLDYLYAVHDSGRILRIRISDQTYTVIANIGLGYGLQDCVYDGANNRLLAVEMLPNAPVKAVSLADGSVTIAAATTFGYFDGITMDGEGFVYVGSFFDDGRVYRYDSDFSEPPILFSRGHRQPTFIYYNRRDSVLAVPDSYYNRVTLIVDMYKVDSDSDGLVDIYDNCPYFTNPGQEDMDLDSIGNDCDNCLDTYNPDQADIDGDGIGDVCEVLRTWQVRADGMGDAPNIQAGIDSCTHGDTVMISDGVYSGAGNRDLDFQGRSILLYSANGPAGTIIDCQGSAGDPRRAFYFDDVSDVPPEIRGLTIRGGYGSDYQGTATGGAVLCLDASPTFVNCAFVNCDALLGGAIYASHSDAEFINCDFVGNTATYGSAIFSFDRSKLILENCVIGYNMAANAVDCMESGDVDLYCSNVFGNQKGNWVGCLIGQQWVNDNFSADPSFCNYQSGDCGLASAESPCLPGNNACGVLIGALELGCSCNCGVTGDMDCDGNTNPVDVVYLVNFVYKSLDALCDPANCPYPTGDVDCNDAVNPVDVVYIVNAVYKSQNAMCDGCNP